ncbi:Slc25a20, partial [Symbiodinium sp. KB8]
TGCARLSGWAGEVSEGNTFGRCGGALPMSLDLRDTLGGVVGSVCLVAAGQPFDTIKLRTQTAVTAADSTIGGALRDLLRKEGAAALWRGAVPAFWSAMVENAVVFSANGALKRLFAGSSSVPDDALSLPQHFLIGGLSGVFSATAICGPEVIKVRAQHRGLAGSARLTPTQALRSLLSTEGPRGLLTGLAPLLVRDVPFNALFFGFYSTYTALLRSAMGIAPGGDLPAAAVLLAGGAAGSTAWTVVFPADTVKSRMQTAAVSGGATADGALAALQAVLREGGTRALYRGWGAAVLRAFPANGALFLGVEATGRLLGSRGDASRQ